MENAAGAEVMVPSDSQALSSLELIYQCRTRTINPIAYLNELPILPGTTYYRYVVNRESVGTELIAGLISFCVVEYWWMGLLKSNGLHSCCSYSILDNILPQFNIFSPK